VAPTAIAAAEAKAADLGERPSMTRVEAGDQMA
jgi:hypothetical protein